MCLNNYDVEKRGCRNWVYNVRDILCTTGFGYVWVNPYVIQCNQFVPIFKNRLVDCFIQKWFNDINNSSPLSLYKHIKCSLHYEQYLEQVVSKPLRSAITKLRISAHNLRIEVGRYGVKRVQICDRVCQLCENR
jgi:hypothetical protein